MIVLVQVWFKNRRAKFRKKQRSLQKEQLQKQKEASGEGADKDDVPPSTTVLPDSQPPPSSSSSSPPLQQDGTSLRPSLDLELNVTSEDQSGSESATEDNGTDREDDNKPQNEDAKSDRAVTPAELSSGCKRLSPKPGKYGGLTGTC